MSEHQQNSLPSSLHTEVAVLGAALVDAVALEDARAKLVPADFYGDVHRRIFAAILATAREGLAVDTTTVCESLRRRKELDAVGGPAYIAFLSEGLPRNLNTESHIRIVKNASLARQGMAALHQGITILSDGGEDARPALEAQRDRLNELIEDHEDPDLHHVSEYFKKHPSVDALYDAMATTQGINTGIAAFNRMTMGYQPKGLSILAARPKMGKTAKMVCDAYHAAVIEEKVTAVFTLEQDESDIMRRMLSGAARVPYADIKGANLSREQRDALLDAQERIMDAPLYISEQYGMTASRICAKCKKLKRDKGLDIIFVDQLSRLKNTDVYRKGMQGREIIGAQTDICKFTAQELEVAFVLLCQLRRFEGKGDARPTLDHLKDSGDIEEDADMVQILHRPRYYNRTSSDPDEIIIAAQREGETGTIECSYNGGIMRWEEIAGQPQQECFDGRYGEAY